MKPSGFGGWIPDTAPVSPAATSASAYASFEAGRTYYVYETDLGRAGVVIGRNGTYTLVAAVSVIWTCPMGLSKQSGTCPAGKTVSVKWLADMAGKTGYGPNRQRRAEMTII